MLLTATLDLHINQSLTNISLIFLCRLKLVMYYLS